MAVCIQREEKKRKENRVAYYVNTWPRFTLCFNPVIPFFFPSLFLSFRLTKFISYRISKEKSTRRWVKFISITVGLYFTRSFYL